MLTHKKILIQTIYKKKIIFKIKRKYLKNQKFRKNKVLIYKNKIIKI